MGDVSYFPCDHWTQCEPPAEGVAVRNFSAEAPDVPSFFGLYQCRLDVSNNPPFSTCTSITSQAAADFCAAACYPDSVFVNEAQTCSAPCGSSFTVPRGTFLGVDTQSANALAHSFACASVAGLCSFSNAAQSCTVTCPDSTSSTYTVPAGVFFGPSQAILNAQAQALACEIAGLQCFGTLFSNTEQSCSAVCPATGGITTVVIPAGTVLGLSQESANARALEIACTLALLACDSLPPLIGNLSQSCSQTCLGVTTTQTVPAGAFVATTQAEADQIAMIWCALTLAAACAEQQEPDAINVGNTPQTCSIPCEGGGTFSSTVQAGAFRLENRAAANAAALSYCQAHVVTNRFCLGALDSGVCVNQVYAAAVSTTGPGTPTVMGVTSGILPPGLSLSGGLLSGIPNTPGSYTFTISAASAHGFAQRTYTITVAEIQTVFLPDGTTSAPYSQAILVAGFTNPVFTIAGGALPTPWTLHPGTGVISGAAADTPGEYSFVVEVTDGSVTCSQDYTVEVTSPAVVQMYWKLDSAVAAANTDSVTGNVLTLNNFGAIVSGQPAKISNGLEITGAAFCTCYEITQNALYLGTGWSWAGWVRWSSVGTGNEGMQWSWCSGPIQNFTWIIGTGEYHFPYDGISELTGNTPVLAADVFHFVAFKYDPATGKLSYSFNGAAFVDLPGNAGVMLVNPEASPYGLCGNEEVIWDEIGFYGFPFTETQKDYLFNGGVGRTFPFSFPS